MRQVAKQGKKAEKLTTLPHHVSSDLLKTAFYEPKAAAAPCGRALRWWERSTVEGISHKRCVLRFRHLS
jgi:hypothetical protein